MRVAPDTEKFFSDYASRALRACAALRSALEACLQPSSKNIVLVRLHNLEVADESINILLDREFHSIEEPKRLEIIDNHPVMIQELSKQRYDIQVLKDCSSLSQEFIETFRIASTKYMF